MEEDKSMGENRSQMEVELMQRLRGDPKKKCQLKDSGAITRNDPTLRLNILLHSTLSQQ